MVCMLAMVMLINSPASSGCLLADFKMYRLENWFAVVFAEISIMTFMYEKLTIMIIL